MTDAESIRTAFTRHLAPTSTEPIGVAIDRAEGAYVYDPHGRRYIDLLGGIGVANIGHTHPEVVAAVEAQNRRHHHVMVYGEYVQENQALYAKELVEVLPDGIDQVFFVNSGAEAVEGALKLARKVTGRAGFVAFYGGYHGDTLGALSVAGNPVYQDPFRPLLGPTRLLPFGEERGLEAVDDTVAAVIVEPVQGEGGVRVPPGEFLPALAARCREVGALLVFDEVMTGFGRTGKLYACEHWGVVPDVLVQAKALGGGYPLGAFMASRQLLETLTHDPPLAHVTTFGGHPVSCAAGRAALNVIRRDRLAERSAKVGDDFQRTLRNRLSFSPAVREVRGLGMMIGVEFFDAAIARAVTQGCRDRDLLLGWTLHHDNILRLVPPLVIGESVLDEAIEILAGVLAQAKTSSSGV